MTTSSVSQQSANPERSSPEDLTRYWKAFVQDLFFGTVKHLALSVVVFSVAFLASALLIHRLGIQPQDLFFLLRWVETLVVVVVYAATGIGLGLIYGANATLLRKTDESTKGIHLIIAPLTAAIVQKMPGGQRSMGLDEFNALVDEQISRFKQRTPFRLRLFSLIGMFSRFFVRSILRILRYLLLHDFVEHLKRNGQNVINAGTVEQYCREKLVAALVKSFRRKLEWVQYGVYGASGVLLVVPVLAVVWSAR